MNTARASRTEFMEGNAGRNALLLLALVVIGVIFQWLTRDSANSFLSARSISTIFVQASVIGVLACGMTFIIILTHIDLSVGSAIAFLGALAAWMMAPRPVPGTEASAYALSQAPTGLAWPAGLVFVAIIAVGALLWWSKGVLQVKTGMPAFIITLGGMMGYRGLAYLIARREIPIDPENFIAKVGTGYLDLRLGWVLMALLLLGAGWRVWKGRGEGLGAALTALAPALLLAGVVVFLQVEHEGIRSATRGIAYLTLLWGLSAFVMSHVAGETVFGRHLYATGGNREAAALCGIHTKKVTLMAFSAMGLLTALAALMYVGQGTAESSAGNLAELDAIAACVLGGVSLMGGRGSVSGAVLGALIMQSLTSGLYQCNVETGYQMLIKAAVLIAVVALDHVFRKQ